jgi:putative SOS response-associated peptidase YedK
MCGRFTLRTRPAELVEILGLFREPDVAATRAAYAATDPGEFHGPG